MTGPRDLAAAPDRFVVVAPALSAVLFRPAFVVHVQSSLCAAAAPLRVGSRQFYGLGAAQSGVAVRLALDAAPPLQGEALLQPLLSVLV